MALIPLLLKYWKPLTAILIVCLLAWSVKITVERIYEAGERAGRLEAEAECAAAFEARRAETERQISEIEAEEQKKRARMASQLAEQREINRQLTGQIDADNRAARTERDRAVFEALEAYRAAGISCPIGDSLRDDYLSSVRAFNSDNGN